MSQSATRLTRAAADLRAAFDRAFAEPEVAVSSGHVDLLAIRLAEHGYVLRLSELSALHAERKLVPVPSPRPELLGLMGVRGLVVPVYDLRRLLGYEPGPAPRWVAIVRTAAPFAVAFEHFETHLRVQPSDVVALEVGAPRAHPFAGGSVSTAAGPRPLIDLPALVAGVTGTRRASAPEGEERR